jgi:cell shape-determining protein MreD
VRWPVFIIAMFLVLVFDAALAPALAIDSQGMNIRPGASAALAVFVALSAPRLTAMWACLILGLMLDFANLISLGGTNEVCIPGPYALGYVFSGYFICQLRSSVFRRRALTIGVLSVGFAFAAAVVVVSCSVIRGWLPGPTLYWTAGTARGELLRQFFCALYSGLLAWPLGWLLIRTSALWGFQSGARMRGWR